MDHDTLCELLVQLTLLMPKNSWCQRTPDTKELLMPKNSWYQRTADAKELLMPKNCWCQRTDDTKELLMPKNCWCQRTDDVTQILTLFLTLSTRQVVVDYMWFIFLLQFFINLRLSDISCISSLEQQAQCFMSLEHWHRIHRSVHMTLTLAFILGTFNLPLMHI